MWCAFSVVGLIAMASLRSQVMGFMNSAFGVLDHHYNFTAYLCKHINLNFGSLSSSRPGKVSRILNLILVLDSRTPEMVLFHDAFIALKARCSRTVNCSPDEYVLGGERQLFQAYIQPIPCQLIPISYHT